MRANFFLLIILISCEIALIRFTPAGWSEYRDIQIVVYIRTKVINVPVGIDKQTKQCDIH